MKREQVFEIEQALREWEVAVRQLLIPVDSQIGRTWDDWTTVVDYSGWLDARTTLFEAMPSDEHAGDLARLAEADAAFMSKTEPDTEGVLGRSGATDGYEPTEEVLKQPWMTRVPTHGVFRRAMERQATDNDARRHQ